MLDIQILKKLANIHVQIVEDDEVISYAIKQSLVKHCKRVEVAGDGLEGFEMFEQNKPDVLIVDINLPHLNGLDMVASIREVSPHIPVIIMTSHDSSDNMLKSIDQGVYIYLRKPISIEELQTGLLMATKDIYNAHVSLEYGYKYEIQDKQLTGPNNEKITLTKMQRDIMHLLISNVDRIVEYSTIENYVWQDKSMSLEALRMIVKKIRHKTYPDIIENISGCGYRINIKS